MGDTKVESIEVDGCEIITFPNIKQERKITCMECIHAYFGAQGIYCETWNQVLVWDNEAEDCPFFEED